MVYHVKQAGCDKTFFCLLSTGESSVGSQHETDMMKYGQSDAHKAIVAIVVQYILPCATLRCC